MSTNRQNRAGFSFVEIMFSLLILGVAIAAAVAGWMYVLRGQRINFVQNELDVNARQAMEKVRSDLRLSSMDKVYFYPAGAGPYTAISFPIARDDNGDGLVELNSSSNIIWDKTVVYHVWNATPNQLRMTTFDPRDNTLTAAQFQSQLDSVVTVGNGSATYGAANATTRPIFENLFTWSIRGKSTQYDCYNATLMRDVLVPLGSIVLSSGAHLFKFNVVGKNTSSSGYKLGIDSLVASPCGISREAEAQTVSAQSGATAASEYMSGGSWDNNYQMAFPATAANQYFTLSLNNDQWEETYFRLGPGVSNRDTEIAFNEGFSPKDYVCRLVPPQTNWTAFGQTLDDVGGYVDDDTLRGAAVRIMLRGSDMMDGGAIQSSGPLHCMYFFAGQSRSLNIVAAYISVSDDRTNYTMNSMTEGILIKSNFTASAGSYNVAQSVNSYFISKTNSYMVTFLVSDTGNCGAEYWEEQHHFSNGVPVPGCWVIPASGHPDCTIARAANWSANTNAVVTNLLFALDHTHVLAASNGYYASPIMDTHLTAPSYSTMTWNSDVPSGASLKMRVRTGNNYTNEMLADATDWTNLTAMTSGGTISPGSGRYVQFQAEMAPDSTSWYVPSLKDVTIKWTGQSLLTDVAATITKGPAYGIFELTVDGNPLVKGVTIDLTIYEDVRGWHGVSNRLTSSVSAEVEPRNTGK